MALFTARRARLTLTIEVRVTRSGQAAPQPGDLTGSVAEVAPGQEGIALLADRVIR